MKTNVSFTVLRYEPILGNGEQINIATICHDYVNGEIHFGQIETSIGRKRLKAFDDNLISEEFTNMLENIRSYIVEPFTVDLFKMQKSKEVFDKFYLYNISTMFLNEIRMSKIAYYDQIDVYKLIADMRDLYFYFDIPSEERPPKHDVINKIRRYVEKYIIDPLDHHNKKVMIHSDYGNRNFDYSLKNSYIQLFNTDVSSIKSKIDQAKSLVFDSTKFVDKKIIVVYFGDNNTVEDRYLLNILKTSDLIEVIYPQDITQLSAYQN